MPKMSPVIHFEMPYKDKDRLSKFYRQVFGWEMQYLPDMGSYVVATTSPVDKNQMHLKKGAINGGFFPEGDYGSMPHVIISVENLKEQIETVRKAGGQIMGEPTEIAGVGMFIMFEDSEGNRVGMLQPLMK